MDTNTANIWNCELCNIQIKKQSKYNHLKSKKHILNLEKSREQQVSSVPPQEKKECLICLEKEYLKKCTCCSQEWCDSCDKKIAECPFCRASLGRMEQLQEIKRLNTNWQLDQEAFSITQQIEGGVHRQQSHLRLLLRLFLDELEF